MYEFPFEKPYPLHSVSINVNFFFFSIFFCTDNLALKEMKYYAITEYWREPWAATWSHTRAFSQGAPVAFPVKQF